MKITVDEDALLTVLHECVRRLLGEFQITEVDGYMREYAKQFLAAIKNCDWHAGLGGGAAPSERQRIPIRFPPPPSVTLLITTTIGGNQYIHTFVPGSPPWRVPSRCRIQAVFDTGGRLALLDWNGKLLREGITADAEEGIVIDCAWGAEKPVRQNLVDRILRTVAECHDSSELWKHLREDPSAFRMAVRATLKQFGTAAARSSEVELLLSEHPIVSS